MEEAQRVVLDYVRQHVNGPRQVPLAGNTIGTDRMFLARFMPRVDRWLHYRNVDVSSLNELSRRWYPRAYFASPEKTGGHRALADILESIQELEYYRRVLFPAEPVTTERAREVAREVVALGIPAMGADNEA